MYFSVNFANFFQSPSFKGCQWMAASESPIQNNPSESRKFSRKRLCQSPIIVKPLALLFAPILLINLKLMVL